MVCPSREKLASCKNEEILRYFRRVFSPSRGRLSQWVNDLDFIRKLQPQPKPYFYWHFKRIMDTIYDFALPNFTQQGTLLDIASNAYFWILLQQKFKGKIISAGVSPDTKEFLVSGNGKNFLYSPIKFIIGEDKLPLEDKSVDSVLLTQVIEHLKAHPQDLLLEIHRVLKPEGKLILTTPNLSSWKKICALLLREEHPYDSSCYGGYQAHNCEYTPYQLMAFLRHIGFKIGHFETRNVYLNDGIPLLARLLKFEHRLNLALAMKLKLLYKQFQRFNSTIFIVAQKDKGSANQKPYIL